MHVIFASHLFLRRLTRPQRLAVMLILAGLVAITLYATGITNRLELAAYDLRLWLRGPRPPAPAIVIVAINDESYNLLRQNIRAWPHANYAQLIDAIAAGKPAVLGLTIAWIYPGITPEDDATLANSIRQAGKLVLASLIEHQVGAGYAYDRYAGPVSPLAETAAGVGLVNLPRDVDGLVRGATLWQFHNGQRYPAFALETARLYQKQLTTPANPATLANEAELLINFYGGPATFPTYSMYQVLSGEVLPQTFTGKIVLVGFTTSLEQDLYATAFNAPWGSPELMPGVEVQANIIATLLNGNPIRRASPWLVISLSLATIGGTALLFWRLRPMLAVSLAAALALLYLVAAFILFAWADLWLPVVAPVGWMSLVATGGLIERVFIEEQEKRRIRARFESFMAPERLNVVLNHWEDLLAENRSEITASVLFSDIRGFTSATETLTRQGRSSEIIHFLNRYTDAMTEAIFEEHGVLDKMMGDGLLVLFGAPESAADHALQAVRSALRMAAILPHLNDIWPLRHQRPLRIGIGIHSGPLLDGLVGRGRRVEYTVIGDAVNTAARIESYTKEVLAMQLDRNGDAGRPGAVILITQATCNLVSDQLRVDAAVPPCIAKGKTEPIPVYRVLGLVGFDQGTGGVL